VPIQRVVPIQKLPPFEVIERKRETRFAERNVILPLSEVTPLSPIATVFEILTAAEMQMMCCIQTGTMWGPWRGTKN
jgi:hypothetical protein